jgi:serine/threonine protein kinase
VPDDVREAERTAENLFGDYVLVQQVGFGGGGVVYRAWQRSLRRFVALKVLHEREQQDRDRATREAQLAARLSHPHIVPIYEVGEHRGHQYLTMKLIAGLAVSKVKVGPARAAALMREVAEAVEHAHQAGIVHRDLKPHNLLLEEGGHVWVTDFGLARQKGGGSTITVGAAVMGTPAYMSPEQARGERCDERSDVYALGATLYELLTGRPPFAGETALAILVQQLRSDPVPPRRVNPKVPAELETIALAAMAKAPERRYRSAHAMADDLRRHLAGEPIRARPPRWPTVVLKWARRHRLVTTALAALAASAVVFALYVVNVARARREAERRVAETLIAEANALGAAGRWEQARTRYLQASEALACR